MLMNSSVCNKALVDIDIMGYGDIVFQYDLVFIIKSMV